MVCCYLMLIQCIMLTKNIQYIGKVVDQSNTIQTDEMHIIKKEKKKKKFFKWNS